jgi:hypothetical protein
LQVSIKRDHRKKKSFIFIYAVFIAVIVLINVLARTSTAFCDFYIKYITPLWTNIFARITSLFPFSIGEFFIALICISPFVAMFFLIYSAIKKRNFRERVLKVGKIYALLFAYLLLTSTLGAAILYHCSSLFEKMDLPQKTYTEQQLSAMYSDYVDKANELAPKVTRDKDGFFVLSEKDREDCAKAVNGLSDEISELKGYIPKAKPILFSDVMGIMSVSGIFFPFTYEANYNNNMDAVSKPATICHELAHAKGFLLEDEANFIGFYACINSDNVNLQYAGYVDIIEEIYVPSYVDDIDGWSELLKKDVARDFEYWNKIDEKFASDTPLSVETIKSIDEISSKVTDSSLKLNAVDDGIKSYGRVIDLALAKYYKDK